MDARNHGETVQKIADEYYQDTSWMMVTKELLGSLLALPRGVSVGQVMDVGGRVRVRLRAEDGCCNPPPVGECVATYTSIPSMFEPVFSGWDSVEDPCTQS